MIFSIWYLFWVLAASSIAAFIVPYLALVVRGSYVSRRVFFLKPLHLFFAALVFFGLWWGSESLDRALLLTAQVVAFMALTFHLFERVESVNLNVLPERIAAASFVGSRYFRLVAQKRLDFEYAVRLRASVSHHGSVRLLLYRLQLTFEAIVSALIDFVVLVRQIVTILQARGGLPHPRSWASPPQRNRSLLTFPVADAVFVIFITIMLVGAKDILMPSALAGLLERLSALFLEVVS